MSIATLNMAARLAIKLSRLTSVDIDLFLLQRHQHYAPLIAIALQYLFARLT
jgi:hypothetical protein